MQITPARHIFLAKENMREKWSENPKLNHKKKKKIVDVIIFFPADIF